ncbi:MAG: PspC domain-containing protein [Flavobacteriales bacterium]|jgi:phage shock protein PspC (stress-responsive transcriptional regulator)|uniref:PspC domain-containing protein n=1 Tax=Candidatus Ulvibacter alkanivorans TaxID=2267620 RepID=UPI000DF2BD63|nr:PspC domain-containing protein [Candidatus Ulvibacter alkanivorans]MCH2488736.1 PspC domain-containing protein [Flavobacteriales bacterium]
MKKTININLAGTFFHIDEDAFGKLQRYLDAIRRSLIEPQGSDEIMRDIEARIAELFSEKIESNAQVISLKELDEVIAVMGQPEDYSVDEELFEEPPTHSSAKARTSYKQLFRDVDNKFISGVSSGLGHYLGIDAIWVRLLWILLTFITSGVAIVIYILFWILVPPALSTADKLKMTGEAVNISNIEKKFKEGYETVADRVKNADYDKYGQKVKSGASGFFDTLGNILLTILKIFVKFIGVILIITSLATLVGLIVGLFTFGSVDFLGSGEFTDYINVFLDAGTPAWLFALLLFFVIGIPFFVLFILGLKLLINNLRSIGTPAKIILLLVWIASLIGLSIFGIKLANEQAYDGDVITETALPIRTADTLRLAMHADTKYSYEVNRHGGIKFKYDENDQKVLYSNDIRLIVRSTTDSVAKLIIERKAEGNSFINAKKRAEAIEYNYEMQGKSLTLDGFFTTDPNNKYRDQELEIILYMPVGSILYADQNTYSFHQNSSRYRDILDNGDEEQYLRILSNSTECLDCPKEVQDTMDETIEASESNGRTESWEEEVKQKFDETSTPVETTTDSLPKQTTIVTDSVQTTNNN